MKKQLYLIRHGETLFNVQQKIQGWCDSPLTVKGRKQAKVVADYLSDIEFDHAYSSTSERCCDTLEYIVGKQSYQRLKGLRERGFGIYEGESERLNPSREVMTYDDFFPNFGGETSEEVKKRVVETLSKVMEQEDHQQVIAYTSAGSCFHFLRNWTDPAEVMKKGISNCTIFKYEYEDHVFTLLDVIRLRLAE